MVRSCLSFDNNFKNFKIILINRTGSLWMDLKDSRGLAKGIKCISAGDKISFRSRKRLAWVSPRLCVGRVKGEPSR